MPKRHQRMLISFNVLIIFYYWLTLSSSPQG